MVNSFLSLNRFKDNFFHGEIDNNFLSFISAFIVFLIIIFSALIFSINSIFGNWQDDLSRNFTVQVLPYYKDANSMNKISKDDVNKRTKAVIDQLDKLKGINSVVVQNEKESQEKISKLLGKNNININTLPLPIIIKITTSEFIEVSAKDIERSVKKIDGVKIFDNKSWVKEFVDFAKAIKKVSYFVILTLFFTAIVVVFYFTKSFLKTQKKVIKVAYVVGAHDEFIAEAFSNRIAFLTSIGVSIGTVISFGVLLLLSYMFTGVQEMLSININISMFGWFSILATPFIICYVFQKVARKTVLRYLIKQH